MKKQAIIEIVAAALVASVPAAHAAGNEGWYAGASLGQSVQRLGGSGLDSAFAGQGITTSTSMDRDTSAWSLFAGYQLNPNFALEGGYVNLGRFHYSSTASAPAADTLSGDYGVRGLEGSALGILPFGSGWSAFGKLGLMYSDTRLNAGSGGAVAVSDESHRGTDPLLGAGLSYDLTQNVSLRGEWTRYFGVGDSATGKGDIDRYSVGVAYRF